MSETCKHLLRGAPDCVFCHRDELKQEVAELTKESHDYREIAERLEQGVLAIAATCPMSAMTRRRLTNLVSADQAPREAVPGDLGLY